MLTNYDESVQNVCITNRIFAIRSPKNSYESEKNPFLLCLVAFNFSVILHNVM